MSSPSEPSNVLDYLREQFAGVHTKLDRISGDVTNLKMQVSSLEADSGHMRIGVAGLNSRLDRMDARLERMEPRMGLIEQ